MFDAFSALCHGDGLDKSIKSHRNSTKLYDDNNNNNDNNNDNNDDDVNHAHPTQMSLPMMYELWIVHQMTMSMMMAMARSAGQGRGQCG